MYSGISASSIQTGYNYEEEVRKASSNQKECTQIPSVQ